MKNPIGIVIWNIRKLYINFAENIYFFTIASSYVRTFHAIKSYLVFFSGIVFCSLRILWISQGNFKLFYFGSSIINWIFSSTLFFGYILHRRNFYFNINYINLLKYSFVSNGYSLDCLDFYKISTLYHPQNHVNIFLFHSYSFIAVFFFSNFIGFYLFKERCGKSKYSRIISDVRDGS